MCSCDYTYDSCVDTVFVDPWHAVTWSLHVVWGEPGEATETDAEAETDLHTMLETASPKESKDKNMITKQAIVQHETHEIKKNGSSFDIANQHHIILDRISRNHSRNVTALLNVGQFSPRYAVYPLKLMSSSEHKNKKSASIAP